MKCFSIDIETTGLDPKVHGVIQVAAIMFDLFDRNAPRKEFIRYISPDNMVWSQYCLKLHAAWLDKVNYRIQHGQWAESPQIQIRPTITDNEISNLNIKERYEPKICKDFAEMQLDFQTWLLSECGFQPPDATGKWPEKILGAGKNFGTFDLQFLLENGMPKGLFFHRTMDPGPLFVFPGDKVPLDLKLCKARAEKLGGKFEQLEVAHEALADARDVIECLHTAYSV